MRDRFVGKWWLPGQESREVAGELRLDGDGPARLELYERLTSGPHGPDDLGIVLGTSLNGEAITLERVGSLGTSIVSSRSTGAVLEREVLTPQIVYAGAHLPDAASRVFSKAVVDLTDLLAWVGPSGLRDEYGPELEDVGVRLDLPAQKMIRLRGAQISISHGWTLTGDGHHSRGIEVSAGFVIESEQSLDFDGWLRAYVGPLRHLLTFAADQANEVTELRLKASKGQDPRTPVDVEVWYPRERITREPAYFGYGFLVDAEDLGDGLDGFVAAWFATCARAGAVMDAMLAPKYRPGAFADNHFLNTAAAAEGYHRIVYRNKVMSAAEHRNLVARVLASAPESDRAWLRELLRYSNEPTFRSRLEELHGRAFQVVEGVVGDAAAFATPVVALRNKLTHRGKGTPAGQVSGADMFRQRLATQFVLTACILLDLGLDEMKVVAATRRWRAFRMLEELDRRARKSGSSHEDGE